MPENIKIQVHSVLVSDGPGYEGVYTYGSYLPLGNLISYAKVYKEGALNNHFNFAPLVMRSQSDFYSYLNQLQTTSSDSPQVWLVSSYVWNHDNNLKMIKEIRKRFSNVLVIVGGPHIPAYESEAMNFLEINQDIDVAVRGEGEITFSDVLDKVTEQKVFFPKVNLKDVPGLTFRFDGGLIRTADRVRNKNLDIYPSPYLTVEFEDASFDNLKGMILETNRGCPFGCTFCDWGSATLQKFSLFDLGRVKGEIDVIAKKGAKAVYLTDSNFGVFERDIEIAQTIADAKKKYGSPKTFGGSFAKNASQRLAEITRILFVSKLKSVGMISIQSTDPEVLSVIARTNIRQEKHEKLMDIFKLQGLSMSSELMIGLPGQSVSSHKGDLQYFMDHKLMTVAFCTAVMPNAPMNAPEYKAKHKIVTDEDGFIISTATFSEVEYGEMIQMFLAFQFFYILGVLKYYLYFLQLEHGIKSMDFIELLLIESEKERRLYPINYQLKSVLLHKTDKALKGLPTLRWVTDDSDFLFMHIDNFFDEIVYFTKCHYGLNLSPSEMDTLLTVQKILMPAIGKEIPFTVRLQHDFVSYFDQVKNMISTESKPDWFVPLSSFPPGVLTVTGMKSKTINNLNLMRLDQHKNSGWELKSKLRF